VAVIDFRDPDWRARFDEAASKPVWFAMAPFGGGELFRDAQNVAVSPWAQAGIPFVRLYGDVPAYFPVKHHQYFPNSINAYGHAEHADFFMRWFTPRAPVLAQPLFPLDRLDLEKVDLNRKVGSALVFFPKNGNSPEALRDFWRDRLAPTLSRALEAVAEEACSAIDLPGDIGGLLIRHFARHSIDITGSRRLLFFLVAQIDDYLRRVKSTMIARALLDLPVTIRGVNWEHVDFRGRHATHDPDSDYTSTRALLDSAIAVVDMSPNTHRGAHDRVLRASGRHTAFLTNRTAFYTDRFDEADRFTFAFAADSIRACVELALAQPRETVEFGLRQAARMRELLTEESYVEQLVSAVDACALNCGGAPEGKQYFVDFSPLP
jgi:hypothetical protein